jgi:hypothetical protein
MILADGIEKKTGYLSNVFAVLMGVFFVPSIFLYIIKPECMASLVLAIVALLPTGCFIYFSTHHCGLRDSRHKKNIEISNDFKGKWMDSGDGTISYIVNGRIKGISK